ncbi:DUF1735 domain-containing protein [Fulvivirga sp. M361]|uniref:DUF1735 domain-containing protein n=1 Tax=Fulvivirga sp. M361 TaxID=2594266 RepID=UPI00117BB941|nr:DUF1735 domain-containing protein [Fulvivirga sp. M361]TRX59156.1 DUF1735 domain-containing protein [Fulvivirga sp. M361]
MLYNNQRMFTIILLAMGALLASCGYDDFVENEFEYTAVYLPKAEIARTFIMDEGMKIGVGVVLGGRLSNDRDVEVTFSLDSTATVDAGYAVLPESHYRLEGPDGQPVSNTIIVPAGKVQGFVYIKADSAIFLSDPVALGHNYALSFQLEEVIGADSILADLTTTTISFSYINQLFGNYVQRGRITRMEKGDPVEPVIYPGGIDDVIALTMHAPDTLIVEGIGESRQSGDKMKIAIGDDNTIDIISFPGATPVTDDGGSRVNRMAREVILNYTFEVNDIIHTARDTLDFRNRVVDGVNQFNL